MTDLLGIKIGEGRVNPPFRVGDPVSTSQVDGRISRISCGQIWVNRPDDPREFGPYWAHQLTLTESAE